MLCLYCFPVKFEKFVGTPIFKNICERLLSVLEWTSCIFTKKRVCTLLRTLIIDSKSSSKTSNPACVYMLKVNNRNTRTRYEICSKLTIKIPERNHCSSVSIVNFEYVIAGWDEKCKLMIFSSALSFRFFTLMCWFGWNFHYNFKNSILYFFKKRNMLLSKECF